MAVSEHVQLGELARGYLDLDGLLSADERAVRERVRAFVDARIRPNIADWYERAEFPVALARELGELGVLGMDLHATAARAAAPSSTGSPRSSSRRTTRACAHS